MKNDLRVRKKTVIVATGILIAVACLSAIALLTGPRAYSNAATTDEAGLLDGYRHVEVSSVSDAMEKITGQRMYM